MTTFVAYPDQGAMHDDQTQANGSYAQVAADGVSEHPNYRFDSTTREWSSAEVSLFGTPVPNLFPFVGAVPGAWANAIKA